jgi:hypothetical protein
MLIIKRIILFIFRAILLLLITLFLVITIPYFFSPVYKFNEPQQFTGSTIYNPYDNIDASKWKKGNFHTHTTASDGKNTYQEVENAYRKYGYDILAITDHSVIARPGKVDEIYIPAYEHGVNISLYHAVLLGAKKGSRFDFIPINTLSNKYFILKWLRSRGDIVVFAHPDKTRWLKPGQMKYLTYYDNMEVEKAIGNGSLAYYDTALSSGHYSGIMANDDCHDIDSPGWFARSATFVNTDGVSYSDIHKALIARKSYAIRMPNFKDADYKLLRSLSLPLMEKLDLIGDTIHFAVSEPADINVFGQNGTIKYTFSETTGIKVPFNSDDTYLRFAAIFNDGVIMYTNPLIRYSGENTGYQDLATTNCFLTIMQTLLLGAVVIFLISLFVLTLKHMFPGLIEIRLHKCGLVKKIRIKSHASN